MKIVRIIARLNIGGPAIHAILLTQGLDKSRFDTLLICGNIDREEGDMLYYSLQRNIEPIFILELKRELNFFNDIVAFKKIYNIIKIEQPDIIHTHTAKAGTLGRLAGILYNLSIHSKDKRVKLVHTFHGHAFEGYFNNFKTKLFILIERFLSFFTCKIITLSESLKKDLISFAISKESKIEIIPLGLELDNFLKIPPRDSVILNIGIVGRLVSIKNHRLFLETAAKVIIDNPGIQLRFKIIGDGELRKDLEEYSTLLGIPSKVDFLGWQRDLVNVYSNLDIVTLTSINEGTPVSLIEAMASGRPVVATDVGGVKDLLGKEIEDPATSKEGFKVLERGIIVKPNDVDSFARALAFILENREIRNKICASSREFVKSAFSKNRLVSDIEKLYCSLLN